MNGNQLQASPHCPTHRRRKNSTTSRRARRRDAERLRDLRPAATPADPPHAADVPLHLLAARPRGLGQRVRDRILIDELAEIADGTRCLPAVAASIPPSPVVETAAQLSGWLRQGPKAAPCFVRALQNIAAFVAVVAESSRRGGPPQTNWAAADAAGDLAGRRRIKSERHHPGASFVMKERVRFEDGRVTARPGTTTRSCASPRSRRSTSR